MQPSGCIMTRPGLCLSGSGRSRKKQLLSPKVDAVTHQFDSGRGFRPLSRSVCLLTSWPAAITGDNCRFCLVNCTGLSLMPRFFARAGKSNFLSPAPPCYQQTGAKFRPLASLSLRSEHDTNSFQTSFGSPRILAVPTKWAQTARL